ncbi:hypothetical protein Tco_0766948 [Tanacetum coccineum]
MWMRTRLMSLLVSWMVTDLEDSETHIVGEVWSGEYIDHGFTKSMLELYRVPVTIGKFYKVDVLCIVDDIDECHILLGIPWRCEVNVEEKIMKAKVVYEHIEKIQDLQSYKQHDDKISTLLCGTRNKVGTLKTCEEIMGINDDEDVKGFRVDVKRKSIEDNVCREKVFEVDEALNIENSRASSFQVRGINVDETKVNAVRDWSSLKILPEVRNNKVAIKHKRS